MSNIKNKFYVNRRRKRSFKLFIINYIIYLFIYLFIYLSIYTYIICNGNPKQEISGLREICKDNCRKKSYLVIFILFNSVPLHGEGPGKPGPIKIIFLIQNEKKCSKVEQ